MAEGKQYVKLIFAHLLVCSLILDKSFNLSRSLVCSSLARIGDPILKKKKNHKKGLVKWLKV
jgi:hypothetical protein